MFPYSKPIILQSKYIEWKLTKYNHTDRPNLKTKHTIWAPGSQIKDFILQCSKLQTKNISRKITNNQHFPWLTEFSWNFCVQNHLTYAPHTSISENILSFSRKGLETMFCLIWCGLVTLDFTNRIFRNLTLPLVHSMAIFASRQLDFIIVLVYTSGLVQPVFISLYCKTYFISVLLT